MLNFEITSTELKLTPVIEDVFYQLTSTELKLTPVIEDVFYQLTSTELECYIRSYGGHIPIFAVVLDFMEIFGGIY